MLLAYASNNNFKLFQMDVKSAFLNGFISEEVYVEQSPGFENDNFPNHVFKLTKALCGLKQAPRAWYERLSSFLIQIISLKARSILHYLLKILKIFFLLFKFMLMILSLVLRMNLFVNPLLKL